MATGRKTGGRKKGVPNKLTQDARQALESAFQGVGGVPALTRWAKETPTEFYKLWGKLIPKDVEVSGKDGGAVEIRVRFEELPVA